MNIFEMSGEREYPSVLMQANYTDGTSRRVAGEVATPEDFLIMCQTVSTSKILPPNISVALIRNDDDEND